MGVTIDSDECARAGGRVVKSNHKTECDDLIYNLFDWPTCLHTTCDSGEYSDHLQDTLDTLETDDDEFSSSYDYRITYDPGFKPTNDCTPACTVHSTELNCVDAGYVWFANSFFGVDFDICLSCKNIRNESSCNSKGCLWIGEECLAYQKCLWIL